MASLSKLSRDGLHRGGAAAIGRSLQDRKVHLTSLLTACAYAAVFLIQRHFMRYYRRIVGDYYTTDDAEWSPNLYPDFKKICKIALPTIWSKEGLGSIVFILLFAVKAILRVTISAIDGRVLTTLVTPRGLRANTSFGSLRAALAAKLSASLAASAVSGCIEHLRHWLITAYRGRLTHYFHNRFYEKLTYYHGTALESHLEAADTVITNYCGEFAEHFAELPYYFLMPFLEATMSLIALVRITGGKSAGMMMAVVLASLSVLRTVTPPFGRIHAAVLQREDEFRRMHTNAINNVESIAMHGAGTFTRNRLNAQFDEVKTSLDEASLAKGHFDMLEGSIAAVWSAAAYAICSLSSSMAGHGGERGKTARMSAAVVQLRLIGDFNVSVKDLIVNIREVSHLSEFTTKLAAFETTLDKVAAGKFHRDPFTHGLGVMTPSTTNDGVSPSSASSPDALGSSTTSSPPQSPQYRGSFRVVENHTSKSRMGSLVTFDHVNVVNPAGTLLVSKLSLDIAEGQDWAIVGPNGCGKSSVLRLMAKLWPPECGRLTLDASVLFCFLPQTPYLLPKSTMVEQICFPDEPMVDDGPLKSNRVASMYGLDTLDSPMSPPPPPPCVRGSITAQERALLSEAMSMATGSSVIDHLGGWDSPTVGLLPTRANREFDWSSLSGGQRQKLALARAFYHARKAEIKGDRCICVLDESTSMMDHEAEQMVFTNLRRCGFRFISVTHREEVLQHHTHVLTLSRDPDDWSVISRERAPL
ncbi:ABC transporter, putative [Bodo saltans]|uniref:ABC transporter, putative n=1 Tax=Bodo saltans TaxID=75058 RepID=A0A0S4JRH8_BODSA|nr:ABC transporter, putative [Bodo saltans]|eukprot:CUG94110.1 ABC transporter, putative [Bodo saltans]